MENRDSNAPGFWSRMRRWSKRKRRISEENISEEDEDDNGENSQNPRRHGCYVLTESGSRDELTSSSSSRVMASLKNEPVESKHRKVDRPARNGPQAPTGHSQNQETIMATSNLWTGGTLGCKSTGSSLASPQPSASNINLSALDMIRRRSTGYTYNIKSPARTSNIDRVTHEEDSGEELEDPTEHWRIFAPASRACRPTFVFDPAGKLCYYWSMVVSLAFLYNLWVIAYRFSFDEITIQTRLRWFCLDYACDFIYLLDIGMQFRTGFLEEGVLQTKITRLRSHYVNSTKFYMDCLSLLPLDFLYLSMGYKSIFRCFRLTKAYRFYLCSEKTERHTNYPNVLRGIMLLHAVLLIFHWNACIVYALRGDLTFPKHFWDEEDKFYNYLNAYYISCRTLMMVETLPAPIDRSKRGLSFVILESVVALVIFAAVLGHVAGIVANVSGPRKQFQAQLDGVKTYMRLRKVPAHLQRKVVRWFDFWWSTKKYGNDRVLECLPDKLKAEISINVHLDTLKRVEIFRNTEPGFLCELVLRLHPMLFSPGDYICRRGEVGNEMYIVSTGRLHVLADDGKTVLATLKAGSYFGEISVLNMGTEGNRRTASVVSVGYSDLFCLSKRDIEQTLQDYPAARNRLEFIAQRRLHQKLAHKLAMDNLTTPHETLTTKMSDSSQRRGSAPAMIHLCTTASRQNMKCSPPPTSVNFVNDKSAPHPSNRPEHITTPKRAFGPAAAFSRSSNAMKMPPPALASVTAPDSGKTNEDVSTLCEIEDINDDTYARSERTQLLLSADDFDDTGACDFANDALVISPISIEEAAISFADHCPQVAVVGATSAGTLKPLARTLPAEEDHHSII